MALAAGFAPTVANGGYGDLNKTMVGNRTLSSLLGGDEFGNLQTAVNDARNAQTSLQGKYDQFNGLQRRDAYDSFTALPEYSRYKDAVNRADGLLTKAFQTGQSQIRGGVDSTTQMKVRNSLYGNDPAGVREQKNLAFGRSIWGPIATGAAVIGAAALPGVLAGGAGAAGSSAGSAATAGTAAGSTGSGIGSFLSGVAKIPSQFGSYIGAQTGSPFLGSVGGGALKGAVLGGGISGVTGQNIGKGILGGALTGGIGGGIGNVASNLVGGTEFGDFLGIDAPTGVGTDPVTGLAQGAGSTAESSKQLLDIVNNGQSAASLSGAGTAAKGLGLMGSGYGSGIGTILGGVNSYMANNKAQKDLLNAQNNSLAALQPYLQSGGAANARLSDLLGTSGNSGAAGYGSLTSAFNPSDLANDPGYQFNLQQGNQALDRQQAAKGGYFSGAALKAAQDYGQGLADNTYTQAFNRDQTVKNQLYSQLAGQAGVGANSANAAGNIYSTIGQAKADAGIANSNVFNRTLASLLGGGYNPYLGF